MGIKGLRDLIKKYFPEFETKVSMKEYKDKTIVVDTSLFIFTYKASRKDIFEEAFISLFTVLLNHGINPIFVFDGKSPKEKSNEKQKRSNKRDASIARTQYLEKEMNDYHTSGIIGPNLKNINAKVDANEDTFSEEKVTKYIEKIKSHIIHICDEDFENVRQLLDMFGIPHVTAKGEAEILCAELVKKGIADAVLTRDTDVLACCVPIMLSYIDLHAKEFIQIKIEPILKHLNLDESSWLDLCIMCGTDFNDNIPRIGPMHSYGYIKKHKNIETIAENVFRVDRLTKEQVKIDISILSHVTTRTLFTYQDELPEIPPRRMINFEQLEKRIKDKNLIFDIKRISPQEHNKNENNCQE
jgi:5'-3' exonuclease